MKKKSQHYIPKFYLKNFIDLRVPGNKIWVFERDKPYKPYLTHPKKIACEPNFYSLADDDEELRIIIENEFGKLESKASQVIKKIISPIMINLNVNERAVLSEFMTYMHTRVPSFRKFHDKAFIDVSKMVVRTMAESEEHLESIIAEYEEYNGNKLNTDIRGLREFMLSKRYEIKIPKSSSLSAMLKVTPDIIKYPFKMCWEFLVAPKDVDFITSDNPMILTVPNREPSFWGVGYFTRNVHLLFPLSPRICLLGRCKRKKDYKYRFVSSSMVRWVNDEIGSHCTNYIFSSNNRVYLPGRVIKGS